jgi:hypothetical protein
MQLIKAIPSSGWHMQTAMDSDVEVEMPAIWAWAWRLVVDRAVWVAGSWKAGNDGKRRFVLVAFKLCVPQPTDVLCWLPLRAKL